MTGWRLSALNLALPGAGLLIAGRLAVGLLLLVPVIILLALILGTLAVFTRGAAWPIVGTFATCYAVLAALAGGLWWWFAQRERFDPAAVRALHRESATAYLQGKRDVALTKAKALVIAAPEESGAWRFLALVAADAGDHPTARRAEQRAQTIDER